MSSKHLRGFSLIELMIVIALVGILSTMAIPSYQNYLKRARFAEVIAATQPFKLAVVLALQEGVPLEELSLGMHGIPLSPLPTKNLEKITLENGTIIAYGTALVEQATYHLKPNAEGNQWVVSGTCLKHNLCTQG